MQGRTLECSAGDDREARPCRGAGTAVHEDNAKPKTWALTAGNAKLEVYSSCGTTPLCVSDNAGNATEICQSTGDIALVYCVENAIEQETIAGYGFGCHWELVAVIDEL